MVRLEILRQLLVGQHPGHAVVALRPAHEGADGGDVVEGGGTHGPDPCPPDPRLVRLLGTMMALVAATDGVVGRTVDLAALHREHFRSLVRLASLLVDDLAVCEELAQEAFARLAAKPRVLRDPDKAPAYLRSAVLNGARSVLRRRDPVPRLRVVSSTAAGPEQPEDAAGRHEEQAAVLAALRTLPDRQRDVLVLRYWMDLSEAEIASTLGIGAGTVKTHTKRGLDTLAARLGDPR